MANLKFNHVPAWVLAKLRKMPFSPLENSSLEFARISADCYELYTQGMAYVVDRHSETVTRRPLL